MKYKYQLILLADNEALFDKIIASLATRFDELKLIGDLLKIITMDNITEYSGGQPAYVIYSGNKNNLDDGALEALKKQKIDGNTILPLFINSFGDEMPDELRNQNGLQFDNNINRICNLVLEGFELLRKNRKIFISYKRTESSNVAIQLYEALEKNNFDVFLDTHSIDKGEEFQEELWHRMTDCDVILMLNTKDFLESEWCGYELEKAHLKRIGIVHLIWPDNDFQNFAQLAHSIKLTNSDFDKPLFSDLAKGRLEIGKVTETIDLIESVRARNLAARQDALITEFIEAANYNNIEVNLQFSRYITENLSDGKRRIYIPTIGVPQSINCFNSEKLIAKIEKGEIDSIHLIYDEMSIRDYWLEHLDWLNKYLKIQTIKKLNFNKWFSTL
ncbi:toll/interleukin-1 receptor domain-containing protein [Flavobacterium aquariorum]|uniref:Toll/interleukin-1 receptor domain-containing protein n=1 Tax=Flavobacterium aquariorum TaxID=2217670 RepID=A0A2W7UCA0_9FLAO|nr:toll/interleukin-1 receptor domain-containing protein [Flavobacterium aquariorum]PZX92807.1 toll/interleukin-1 receptor domain-containing protein [Flavobacterium aquariorum]